MNQQLRQGPTSNSSRNCPEVKQRAVENHRRLRVRAGFGNSTSTPHAIVVRWNAQAKSACSVLAILSIRSARLKKRSQTTWSCIDQSALAIEVQASRRVAVLLDCPGGVVYRENSGKVGVSARPKGQGSTP